jgi:hypothetical protein
MQSGHNTCNSAMLDISEFQFPNHLRWKFQVLSCGIELEISYHRPHQGPKRLTQSQKTLKHSRYVDKQPSDWCSSILTRSVTYEYKRLGVRGRSSS